RARRNQRASAPRRRLALDQLQSRGSCGRRLVPRAVIEAVLGSRRPSADIAELEIAAHEFGLARVRVAEAAAARALHHHHVAGLERERRHLARQCRRHHLLASTAHDEAVGAPACPPFTPYGGMTFLSERTE